MITDKLQKRQIVRVMEPDIPERKVHVVNDSKTNCMMVTWNLIKDVDLEPGDEMIVDVRILVDRRKEKN